MERPGLILLCPLWSEHRVTMCAVHTEPGQMPFRSVLPIHRLLAADVGATEVRTMSVLNVLGTTLNVVSDWEQSFLPSPGTGMPACREAKARL